MTRIVVTCLLLSGCSWTTLSDGTKHRTLLQRTVLQVGGVPAVTSDSDRALDHISAGVAQAPEWVKDLTRDGARQATAP